MHEQQSKEVAGQDNVAETRKEWCAPRLRIAGVERETQSTLAGMTDAGSLLS